MKRNSVVIMVDFVAVTILWKQLSRLSVISLSQASVTFLLWQVSFFLFPKKLALAFPQVKVFGEAA